MQVKCLNLLLLSGLLLAGCATSSIDSRRQERLSGYEAFGAETKALVDQGQIKVGMTEDAVYIAWGPPAQTTRGENKEGETIVWIYEGMWMQERANWNTRVVAVGRRPYVEHFLDRTYYPRNYPRAEVTFSKGLVTDWKTLPRPY
jgi:outer membrane lipoprotein-sorting protein